MKTSKPAPFASKTIGINLITFLFLSLIGLIPLIAQDTRLISGTLTDDSGDALPGVTILIKGSNTGTITDINGNYSIEAPIGSNLVYNFIGFEPKEVLVEPLVVEETDTIDTEDTKILRHKIPKSDDKTLSPYFFVKSDNPETDRLPLKSTSADVTISGVIADVTVKQLYVNEGSSTIEAIYIFPGSVNSAVYGMNMRIGKRLLIADIREKKQARKDYEEAKKQGKTATLLEQNRPNVFQMNVANILPGDSIEVSLFYTELISAREGIYEFIYPTVVGPRYANESTDKDDNWIANPYLSEGEKAPYTFDLNVQLNSGIPVKKLFSNTHAIQANYSDTNSVSIRLDENEKDGGNRDFILQYGLRGGKVESGVLLYENGDENFFLLMMEPPVTPEPEHIPGREYIFVVDISGSMSGFPLDVSKAAINTLLKRLRPSDKFNIMAFAGSSQMMWNESKPATASNIKHGIEFSNMKTGGGGTELKRALEYALNLKTSENYSRTFIVLTDGYVSFEKQTFISVRENLNEANLFAMGIGSSVNRYLIDGLAHAGMGEPYVATTQEEAERVAGKLIDYIEKPVLTNISIDFGELDAYDYEPSSIPDVFAQRTIMVYGKYKGNANGTIKVKGITGNTHYTKHFNLKKAKKDNNAALRYLWARNKIKYLDDYSHYYTQGHNYRNNENEDIKKEVTQLGLKYNLLTQYTSFIAIDSIIRNTHNESVTIKQPLPLPKGVSNYAISNLLSTDVNYGQMSLSPDIESLQEVVVIGYGTQKKSCVTGSTSSFSANNIIQQSNVTNALQGMVSGVSIVNNSGTPGSNASIRVRGLNSVSGDNTPLVVVDGIVQSTPSALSELDMQNISSVSVLKDAAATGVYGSRAANGVIVISTKSGSSYSKKLEFKAKTGVNYANLNNTVDRNSLWYKDSLNSNTFQQYNLSYNYNNYNLAFYTSGSYLKNNGVIKTTGMQQFATNNQLSYNLFDNKLLLNLTLHGANTTNDFLIPNYPDSSNQEINTLALTNNQNKIQSKVAIDFNLLDGLKLKTSIANLNSKQKLSFVNVEDSYSNQNVGNTLINGGIYFTKNFTDHELQLSANYEYFEEQDELKLQSQQQGDGESLYSIKDQALNLVVNYNYYEKYLLSLNYRTEMNIEGIEEGKWTSLPSLSAGYILSNEQFMSPINFISNSKIRYSIGMNGRSKLAKHYYANGLFSPLGITSQTVDIIIPPTLKREATLSQNLGLDLGFLYNRLTASFDYFFNTTSNMFYLSQNSPTNYEWTNIGDYQNKGIDFELNYRVINRNRTRLTLGLNLAKNNTSMKRLTNEKPAGVIRNVNGYIIGQELKQNAPIGVFYGYKVVSVDNENKTIALEDKNGNSEIENEDRIAIANTNPKLYGGFVIDASYSNWEFNTKLTYSYGNKVVNINRMFEYNDYSYNGNITAPKNTLFNNLFVEDASYLRFSDITLSYNFNRVTRIKLIDRIRLSLSANNLITLTKYKGQDPEFNNWQAGDFYSAQTLPGVDMNYYPVSKGVYLTLEVEF